MTNRFINNQVETLVLTRDLVFDLLPKIIRTARALARFADFEGDPMAALRASTAHWLWTGEVFRDFDTPIRASLAAYYRTGDTAAEPPF